MNRREKLQQASLSGIFPNGSVVIVHPGCDAALFSFPAFPHPDPASPTNTLYGMPSCLVLDACRALTNYAAKDDQDFFARDHAGEDPVPIQVDRVDILGAGCYYYFLGPPATAANAKYPIVKEFAALTFPHDFPRHWSRTAVSASSATSLLVIAREQLTVGRSLTPYGLDIAALVPPSEVDWFNANEMHRYTPVEAGLEDAANWITLRGDMRDIFYNHGFVFYPAGDGIMHVGYYLDTAHLDYAAEYHRRPVKIHVEVPDELVYARFAYAVINLARCDDLFEAVPVGGAVKQARRERRFKEAIEGAALAIRRELQEAIRLGIPPATPFNLFDYIKEEDRAALTASASTA